MNANLKTWKAKAAIGFMGAIMTLFISAAESRANMPTPGGGYIFGFFEHISIGVNGGGAALVCPKVKNYNSGVWPLEKQPEIQAADETWVKHVPEFNQMAVDALKNLTGFQDVSSRDNPQDPDTVNVRVLFYCRQVQVGEQTVPVSILALTLHRKGLCDGIRGIKGVFEEPFYAAKPVTEDPTPFKEALTRLLEREVAPQITAALQFRKEFPDQWALKNKPDATCP